MRSPGVSTARDRCSDFFLSQSVSPSAAQKVRELTRSPSLSVVRNRKLQRSRPPRFLCTFIRPTGFDKNEDAASPPAPHPRPTTGPPKQRNACTQAAPQAAPMTLPLLGSARLTPLLPHTPPDKLWPHHRDRGTARRRGGGAPTTPVTWLSTASFTFATYSTHSPALLIVDKGSKEVQHPAFWGPFVVVVVSGRTPRPRQAKAVQGPAPKCLRVGR